MVAVDAGGLLFKSNALTPELTAQEQAAATGVAEAYRLMRYDAVGITGQDLAAGLPFLQQLAHRTALPWLSADLVQRNTGKPFFPASVIKKIGNLRVGVFALSGPAATAALRPEDQAMVQPWQEVVPGVLGQLKKADLVILLSGLPTAENEALAQRHPEVDLIVRAGDDGASNQPPRQVRNTLLLQTEKQGKSLGVLDIQWNASRQWGEDRATLLTTKRSELDQVEWFLRGHGRKGDPEVLYQNEPAKLKAYRELVAEKQRLEEEIKRLNGELTKGTGRPEPLAKNRFLALYAELPDQPAVQAVVERTTKTMNQLGQELAKRHLEQDKKGISAPGPLVGWQRCAGCHRAEADFWRQSRHAKAYATLRAKNQQFNQTCLPCHVTGPASTAMPESLQAVGCESCHGPGREHSNDPKRPMVKQPPAQSCLGCHTPEHDDNFDFSRDRHRLNCIHVR